MQNQSNREITFDIQWKTALLCKVANEVANLPFILWKQLKGEHSFRNKLIYFIEVLNLRTLSPFRIFFFVK